MANLDSAKDIYARILDEVDALIASLGQQKEDDDNEIKMAAENVRHGLTEHREKIQSSLAELGKNSEWDTFTMAFYGETNAGKSTLIETLRILLSEPEKVKQRQLFSQRSDEYKKIVNELDGIKTDEERFCAESRDIDNELQKRREETDSLENKIVELKKSIKIGWNTDVMVFFRYIFRALPVQKEVSELEKKKTAEKKIIADLASRHAVLEVKLAKNKAHQDKVTEQMNASSEKLMECEDGNGIIGDGRSDFTRAATTYTLELNNQKFAFVDLPGIEGREQLVLGEINAKVQTAHAVFYITRKDTPPQTGGNETEGTLEKIKKHLGQQTEVYTIYNKSAQNANQLEPELINSEDKKSLKILDQKMSETLGEHYQGHKALSAYPAFLAVGNCWQEKTRKKQDKLLQHFGSRHALLDKTNVGEFTDWVTKSIVTDCK